MTDSDFNPNSVPDFTIDEVGTKRGTKRGRSSFRGVPQNVPQATSTADTRVASRRNLTKGCRGSTMLIHCWTATKETSDDQETGQAREQSRTGH